MAVTSISRNFNTVPQIVNMLSTDTLVQVATAGYLTAQAANISVLNSGTWEWQPSDVVLVDASDGIAFFELSTDLTSLNPIQVGNGAVTLPVVNNDFVNFNGTLGGLKDSGYSPSDATKTKVVMAGSAVQVGYIAHFVDTAGTIDDTAGTIQNDGVIQSGKSGVVGGFIAYPPTAANGFLELLAINAGGAFNTIISNSVMGQTSTISIPDPGASTANFIISKSGSTQHIASGNLQLDVGNLLVGSSGNAAILEIFPATAANGVLELAAVNAGGAFNTTISNSAMGQSSVISIPDPGVATSKFLLTDSATSQAISTGNLSLTVGTLTLGSSGHASSLTLFPGTAANGTLIINPVNAGGAFNTTISNGVMGQSTVYTIPDIGAATGDIVVSTTAVRMKSVAQAAVAGGAAAQTVTDTFCTSGSNVICTWNDTTNPVSIQKAVAGNGSFVVTSSGDPGASHLNYIIMK